MLKLKLQYFTWCERANSCTWCKEPTHWMLGKIEGRRRRGQQSTRWLDGITDSMAWICTISGRQWRTEVWGASVHGGRKELDMTEWLKNSNKLPRSDGAGCHDLSFFNISFHSPSSPSDSRFFSDSLFSTIRVVSSAYLRLLAIFLLAVSILACNSSSRAFLMMWSVYKLNKWGDIFK